MPVTSYCFIIRPSFSNCIVISFHIMSVYTLFHQLLQSCDKLVYDLVPAFFYISCNAASYMACQQFLIEGIHCGIDGGGLNKYIVTVCVILNHSLVCHCTCPSMRLRRLRRAFLCFSSLTVCFSQHGQTFLIIVLFSLIALPLIFAVALIYPHGVF